jgi:hypothetical protein
LQTHPQPAKGDENSASIDVDAEINFAAIPRSYRFADRTSGALGRSSRGDVASD